MFSSAGPFTAAHPVILASGSPRRRAFFEQMGIPFEVILPVDAEPSPIEGEQPEVYVRRAAEAKARAVAADHKGRLVVAADTVVALDDTILGKPASADDALSMLRRLAGRTHVVASGCCVILPEGGRETFHAITRVTMWDCPEEALAAYVATGEPSDKAGAYGIQGIGAFLVRAIEGSWTNVVGLPVAELTALLLRRGAIRCQLPVEAVHA